MRPMLLYRATCAKCRTLSALVAALSAGWIRRVAVDAPEALELYARYGAAPGTLALLYRGALYTRWTVPAFALMAMPGGVLRAARRLRGG
ncbi:MAG TPA: hypothetical protein VMD91_02480 [Candidatus Sulfotelmatobacter sp.]|nr:hypothetical protein [Candidatus Sulfotelmatobacter sp.]